MARRRHPRSGRSVALLLATLGTMGSSPAAAEEPEKAPPAAQVTEPSNTRLRFDVGFAHWFPDQFRHGNDVTSQSFGMGVRPGLSWAELRVRYDRTRVKSLETDPFAPAFDGRRAQFFTAEAALSRTLRLGDAQIDFNIALGFVVAFLE